MIELGCVELVNRKLTGNNLHFYFNPGRESHEEALKVHGITTEFLKDKPQFELVVDELLAYLQDAHIVIHNAPFDVGFLNHELARTGKPKFSEWVASITDTLVMAKEMFPGKRNSLDALCSRLDVDNSGRTLHGALLDAELLADVYRDASDKRIIVLEQNYPFEYILHNFPEPLFAVYPRKTDQSWGIKAIRKNPKTFTNRKNFPKSWAGLRDLELQKITGISDAIFCHKGLFLAGAKSKEGAIALAQLALQDNLKPSA